MRPDDIQHTDHQQWRQISVKFGDPHAAERQVIAHFGPVLLKAESDGLVSSWFFIRKPWWRLRYRASDGASESEAKRLIEDAAESLRAAGHASQWVEIIYEPETHAFGGEEGMEVAHDLFYQDSRRIFEHLGRHGDQSHRRELSIVLCAALMRAAEQDWWEQGDIWAKVSDLRPARNDAQPESWRNYKAAVRQLIAADTGPETSLPINNTLGFVGDWLTAFEHAGKSLRALHYEGLLTRGMRAVIGHHIIFHWNRIGLSNRTQAAISQAIKEAIFDEDEE